ncbi:MAG: DUF3592 domain-containing protein [Bacteroidales bacterium]|nr:DUF3592 domain-containing protein [Bacteroidales bacterium]
MRVLLVVMVSVLMSVTSYAQTAQPRQIDWQETEAKIISIETFRTRRKLNEKATVVYTVKEDNKEYESRVLLDRFPLIGSMKSEGDVITVLYDKDNPLILQTESNVFMTKYGLYILIAGGIGIMFFYYRNFFKKRSKKNLLNQ